METNDEKMNQESNLFLKFGFEDRYKGFLVIAVSGVIDTYTVNMFQKQIETVISNGHVRLVFNLEDTSFVTGSGVGAFVSLLKKVRSLGGEIILINMGYQALDIFQLLGITDLFTIIMDDLTQIPRIDSKGSYESDIEEYICPVCGINIGSSEGEYIKCRACGTLIEMKKSGNLLEGRQI